MKTTNVSLADKRKRETHIAALVFLAPIAILLVIYIFYPIIDTFITSFYKWNGITIDKTPVGF